MQNNRSNGNKAQIQMNGDIPILFINKYNVEN